MVHLSKTLDEEYLMQTLEIPDFGAFDQAVGKFNRSALCRGVSDSGYELKPSLFRGKKTDELKTLESNLMWVFKTQAKAHLATYPSSELEWLVLAQHHGLPTRLLDWSLSPLAALFFAVQSRLDTDGAIYLLDRGKFRKEEDIDLKTLTEVVAFFPSHLSRRITAQSGMFTAHPLTGNAFDEPDIVKLIIPAKSKKMLLAKLVKYGVHHGTIFPDLDGLSNYLRYLHRY